MTHENKLYVESIIERSKFDNEMIVGSEIRQAIGILQREIEELQIAQDCEEQNCHCEKTCCQF